MRQGEADLIVAKHRNGPTRTITVASQLHFARFSDMAASSNFSAPTQQSGPSDSFTGGFN
jgi:replicative DNA helicase